VLKLVWQGGPWPAPGGRHCSRGPWGCGEPTRIRLPRVGTGLRFRPSANSSAQQGARAPLRSGLPLAKLCQQNCGYHTADRQIIARMVLLADAAPYRSAIASQLRRNAERLQHSAAHTSSALVFLPRIANSPRGWQHSAHRHFTPQRGTPPPPFERLAPKHPGGQFSFGVSGWSIAAVAALQGTGKARLQAPFCRQCPPRALARSFGR
jgi:hypothetical protein